MIQATALQARRGSRVVLRIEHLQLQPGSCVAVVGPNGAGKSTLLHLMSGALSPRTGHVDVHGLDPAKTSPRARAARMAVLTQQENASPFPVRDVLEMGLFAVPASSGGPKRAAAKWQDRTSGQRIDRMLDHLELTALAERPLDRLSGGQQRRVQLARVLLQAEAFAEAAPLPSGKPWILLDEPTDALDPRHALLVVDRLRRKANAGHGVLAVLHDLNLAAFMADRVLLIHEGRLLADGPPEGVLTPALLEQAYGCPFQRVPMPGNDAAGGTMRSMLQPLPHASFQRTAMHASIG
jgi:iron complex transport system ATP-binding protein